MHIASTPMPRSGQSTPPTRAPRNGDGKTCAWEELARLRKLNLDRPLPLDLVNGIGHAAAGC
jgi:hypothetical protein